MYSRNTVPTARSASVAGARGQLSQMWVCAVCWSVTSAVLGLRNRRVEVRVDARDRDARFVARAAGVDRDTQLVQLARHLLGAALARARDLQHLERQAHETVVDPADVVVVLHREQPVALVLDRDQ